MPVMMLNGRPEESSMMGATVKSDDEMLPQVSTALRVPGLKHRAGDPAMPLVVIGIAAFEEREAAVLRLESGLQVGGVVDGVRPGVAG